MTTNIFRVSVSGLKENPKDKNWDSFKKYFFTNILESPEDNIVLEKSRWQRSETESDSRDSDSSIKFFKNTLTNLLYNCFFFLCAQAWYMENIYI